MSGMEDSSHNLDDRINLKGFFERILAERDKRDLERDRRLDERFDAQEKAVTAALATAEKAVQAAFAAAEKAVNAALAAAKEAVTKAEDNAKETTTTHNKSLAELKSFQSKILGALGLMMVFFPTITGVAIFLLTRQPDAVPVVTVTTP